MKKLQTPLKRFKITQGFGENPQIYRQFGMKGHNGIDLRTKRIKSPIKGRTRCYAAADGKVILVKKSKSGYGKHIKIRHYDGSETIYAHLYTINTKKGDRVKRGQFIAITDNTGFSTGPHLHFGYRPAKPNMQNGYFGWVNPLPFLDRKWKAPK